jgi:hypothetical protein
MATEITSRVVISPSISGQIQSSLINGSIVIVPSISGTILTSLIAGRIEISLDNTRIADWPETGVTSTWLLNSEQFVYVPGVSITLPIFKFQGMGQDNPLGVLSITIPSLDLSVWGDVDPLGILDLVIPRLQSSILGNVSENGTLSISIPSLVISLSGAMGGVGRLSVNVPSLKLSASGSPTTFEGTLSVNLPMLNVLFQSLATTYLNMVLNIRNNALTIYDNYDFNSFCRFNGKNLGATSTQIYDLDSGDTDKGTCIDWNFRTGYFDLHQKVKKSLRQAWISYKSSGDLIMTAIQPDGVEYEYSLGGIEITEDGVRVKFGKGIRSKYIALDIKNVDGSSITLDTMKLLFDKTSKER